MRNNPYLMGSAVALGVLLLPWQLTAIAAVLSIMYYLTTLGRRLTKTIWPLEESRSVP